MGDRRDDIFPSVERIREIRRTGISLQDARAQAMQEKLYQAIDNAENIFDLRYVLRAVVREMWRQS